MNQRCILYYNYLTTNTRTIRSIIPKNTLELFIASWSYSDDQKRVFATYHIMRANRTSWAGTRLVLKEDISDVAVRSDEEIPLELG